MGQNWKSLEPVDVKLLENAEDISQKKGQICETHPQG